jgi:hypothetical protein
MELNQQKQLMEEMVTQIFHRIDNLRTKFIEKEYDQPQEVKIEVEQLSNIKIEQNQ